MLERLTSPFSIIISLLNVVLKRIRHNLGLSISAIFGIVAVMSIIVAVPIFSHAVSSKVLRNQLEEKAASTQRPLLSQHIYNIDTTGTMTVDHVKTITDELLDRYPRLMNLKVENLQQEIQSINYPWQAVEPTRRLNTGEPWMDMAFVVEESLPEKAELVAGEWPSLNAEEDLIQVAVIEKVADEYLLNVGDQFQSKNLNIEISGIWRPRTLSPSAWFEDPFTGFKNKLWVTEEIYQKKVIPRIEKPVFYASWFLNASETNLDFSKAGQYARGLIRLDADLRRMLPEIKSDYTPLAAFIEYQVRAQTLTTLIFAVSGPMVIMALLFIGLTANISIQQYEQETATMRGRGSSWLQVVGLNLVESFLLVLISIPLSLLFGWFAALAMGKTLSFLQFTNRTGLEFTFSGLGVTWMVLGACLVVGARFLPMLNLSRSTIVKVKQEQTRSLNKPIWQKFYLDFFLLIPGIYAYVILRGFIKPTKILPSLDITAGQPYQDPLLFVAPSLFAIGLCMICLRVLPFLVNLVSRLVDRLPGVWAYLSIQQIARRPQDHSNALLLIMISLGLSIFSASTARTLDQWLYDSIYYRSGSDLAIHEYILEGVGNTTFNLSGNSPAATISELDLNSQGYISLEDHQKLPMVEAASRVGKYEGTFSYGVGEEPVTVMGIDRLEFPEVAFYREDFASQPLGALMNALGLEPLGVLVPEYLLEETGLQVGDQINLAINTLDQSFEREMVIAGVYDYFPTVYPVKNPTLIVNLESIFDNPEAVIGYDIWLRLREDADIPFVIYQIRQLMGADRALVRTKGNAVNDYNESLEQAERVGVFGVLNVGFLVTGMMPAIGFVLYSYASLRRRFIQLGILQAIGMSVRQLIGYISLEQSLLMGLAILAGSLAGILTSYLFVPLLQVAAAGGVAVPSFKVLIGWREALAISLAFSIVLFLTIVGTIYYLARMKVFQAVKMGETL
jgi:putative ABC transport system permease protein